MVGVLDEIVVVVVDDPGVAACRVGFSKTNVDGIAYGNI
jgi:hypothetical protein